MNDVKIQNTSFELRQSSAASSSGKPVPAEQGKSPDVSTSKTEEQVKLRESLQKDGQENVEKSKEAVQEAVTRLNDYVQSVQRDLQFQLDESSGKTVVTVLDSHTNEVVRQIPDDVALRLAQELQQDEPLSLFNAKV